MADKIYCGSARIINTQFGDLTKVSFHKDDINKMVQFMRGGAKDWVNLVIKEKRDKQEGKPTHYLEIDDWQPTSNAAPIQVQKPSTSQDDDLPF